MSHETTKPPIRRNLGLRKDRPESIPSLSADDSAPEAEMGQTNGDEVKSGNFGAFDPRNRGGRPPILGVHVGHLTDDDEDDSGVVEDRLDDLEEDANTIFDSLIELTDRVSTIETDARHSNNEVAKAKVVIKMIEVLLKNAAVDRMSGAGEFITEVRAALFPEDAA